jgi:mycothione reductase
MGAGGDEVGGRVAHFDLVIIGTGSGNSIIDERFADWRVAIVEKGVFGGTCLNVGCIPTKMFVHSADLAAAPSAAAKLGVDLEFKGVRWTEVRDRIFGRIDPISSGGREYRHTHADNANVTVFEGTASFTGPRALRVALTDGGTAELTAERVVLAAGGRPIVLDELANVPFHTSDTVMRIDELPRRMVIVGTGFVAAEFAHVFSAFGVDVTILGRSGTMLRQEDADISERFTELARQRWDLRASTTLTGATTVDGGIRLALSDGSSLETDLVLVAIGRTPNSDLLNLPAAGVDVTPSGHVVVDSTQHTTADGVWALGDIASPIELKHVANHEARVVRHNLLHPEAPIDANHHYIPHAVFSSPQVASVGLTEREARAVGARYVTAKQDYAGIAYGWAMEDTSGFAKLLADPATGQLLGAHIIGPQAATLIQPLVQAMSLGLDARTMARDQYWIHPAMPELIENALLSLPLD